MQMLEEDVAVERVTQRLAVRYPEIAAATVRAMVHEAHDEIDGPVRTYVPVLVEHEVRDRLAHLRSSNRARRAREVAPTRE